MLKDIDFCYFLAYIPGMEILESIAAQGFFAISKIGLFSLHNCNK
jgi:hypothetical protein